MTNSPDTNLRLSALPPGDRHPFSLSPDAEQRADLARRQGLDALRKLSFVGELVPEGKRDWRLEAKLGATVVQPCVTTLNPVTTRIDEKIIRRYLAAPVRQAEGEEIEMPEDDSAESMPEVLDLAAVMEEALALFIPLYPRQAEAELEQSAFAAPGVAPMQDDDVKPFAGLAELKKKLSGGTPDDGAKG